MKNHRAHAPKLKKVSEFIHSHKEKKYISLMLVPSDSNGKTRSVQIPFVVFCGTIFMFFSIFAAVGGFYLRGKYFENLTQKVGFSLEETIENFDGFREFAENTHIDLRNESLQVFSQLTGEHARAQAELEAQKIEHRSDFEATLAYIENLEKLLFEFETERVELLEFLNKRGTQIPPISDAVRELELSQENLYENLKGETNGEFVLGASHDASARSELTRNMPLLPRVAKTKFEISRGKNYTQTHENSHSQTTNKVSFLNAANFSEVSDAELISRLETLAQELKIQHELLKDIESHKSKMGSYLQNYPTLMPVDGGVITSGFGARRDPITGATAFHYAVDIPAPKDTPIRAAGGGIVSFSGWRNGYGNVIYIDHGNGIETRYAHNSQNAAQEGESVSRGQIIGYVGSTGRSISMHLHYEVLRNGQFLNPVPFISEDYK